MLDQDIHVHINVQNRFIKFIVKSVSNHQIRFLNKMFSRLFVKDYQVKVEMCT